LTTVRIDRIGVDGDGVGHLPDGKPAYLPFTLPGELVEAELTERRGQGWTGDARVVVESPDRVLPPCPHFGPCGGCSLQHLADRPYAEWKSGLLRAALIRAGFADAVVAPLVRTPPGARRRMELAAKRLPSGVALGLHVRNGTAVVDLADCAVLHPTLAELVPGLRDLLRGLSGLKREGDVLVNLLDEGPDILLRIDGNLTTPDRTKLAAFAAAWGAPRISVSRDGARPEIAAQLRPARMTLSGTEISPAAGAFLQASAEGEAAIIAAMLAGLPAKLSRRAQVAELYAGCGSLTFALAKYVRVAAFDGDGDLTEALAGGANRSGQAGRISVTRRDLTRQPLSAKEFAPFAAVVLDPPHAGAAAQTEQIAASGITRVIYVSCNPATLERDAAVLRLAGYRLLSATPIDQFLWSARLESVVVFDKGK
jgi:23S rRNA (uracil1939-C5)-methyltransferase